MSSVRKHDKNEICQINPDHFFHFCFLQLQIGPILTLLTPSESNRSESPQSENAEVSMPQSETVEASTPQSEIVEASTPQSETVEASTPQSETVEALTPQSETVEASTPQSENTPASSCCSFNDGQTCVEGEFCNFSQTNCEVACSPGKWVLQKKPTSGPTHLSSFTPSITPYCCSFDEGQSCVKGEFCNTDEATCEGICSPGKWVMRVKPIPAPTPISSTTPSMVPFCCSFDGGISCGNGGICNTSKSNCEEVCSPGKWIQKSNPSIARTVSDSSAMPSMAPTASDSSAMPSMAPTCCSFDGGKTCGEEGGFCNSSKTNCENICTPGIWTIQLSKISHNPSSAKSSFPSPIPTSSLSSLPSTSANPSMTPSTTPTATPSSVPSTTPTMTPSCCSFDGGQSCGIGEYCNSSKKNCEDELGCAGEWIIEIKPTPTPTLTLSSTPSMAPRCCSFDGGQNCGGGNFCNMSASNCENGCSPGKWVHEIKPTSAPTPTHSMMPSELPACCSFNGGQNCGGGDFCNSSRSNCEAIVGCAGDWVREITPTATPTISSMPSQTPSCCSFDNGKSCGGGLFCNGSKTNCENECAPGEWMKPVKPTPSPTMNPSTSPSMTPSCCSFDDGKTCGRGNYCNTSKTNCEAGCSGDWVMEIKATLTPTPQPSVTPTTSPSCCSFDSGNTCAGGDVCNMSKAICENGCAPGEWVVQKRSSSVITTDTPTSVPTPIPAPTMLISRAAPTSCCSWNGGESCGEGEWCNGSRENCEESCFAEWVSIRGRGAGRSSSRFPHLGGCCSWNGGESCYGGMWCNQSQDMCENQCRGEWFFK